MSYLIARWYLLFKGSEQAMKPKQRPLAYQIISFNMTLENDLWLKCLQLSLGLVIFFVLTPHVHHCSWLLRKSRWFWVDWSSCPLFDCWTAYISHPLHYQREGSAQVGFEAVSVPKRPDSDSDSPELTAVAPPNLAPAGYWPRCSSVMHFCPNQFVRSVVFPPRTPHAGRRICFGRCDSLEGRPRRKLFAMLAPVPSKPDSWSCIQPVLAESDVARESSKSDFWWFVQPALAGSDVATESSKFDFWFKFQRALARSDVARESSKSDFWLSVQPALAGSDVATESSKFDFWFKFQRALARSDVARES